MQKGAVTETSHIQRSILQTFQNQDLAGQGSHDRACETSVLGLSLAYVLLSTLLLAVMIWLPIRRLFKIAAILAASVFYVVVFFATQGLLGWSAPVAVPDRFQVLWTRVLEPNPSRGEPGAIHLWLEELDDANLPSGVPRAYLLPYSRGAGRPGLGRAGGDREGQPAGRPGAVSSAARRMPA